MFFTTTSDCHPSLIQKQGSIIRGSFHNRSLCVPLLLILGVRTFKNIIELKHKLFININILYIHFMIYINNTSLQKKVHLKCFLCHFHFWFQICSLFSLPSQVPGIRHNISLTDKFPNNLCNLCDPYTKNNQYKFGNPG
jgi:hypothetical protein